MGSMILKRVLIMIPLLFGITLISFMIMMLAPGDPSDLYMDPQMRIEDKAILKHNLGLDQSIFAQYRHWIGGILKGNFGYSYINGKPVAKLILERLPATLLLSISTLVLILIITFPLGLISGAKKDSMMDTLVTVGSFVGMSMPSFWLGLIFILFFSLRLDWFPSSGFMDPRFLDSSTFAQVGNVLHHLFLPLLTSVVGSLAGLIRYFRFGIIEILDEDFILAARSRGLSEKLILFKHAFKNAALPIVTLLGLQLPGLIGGSFIIEFIFSWPGLGQLGISAVYARDYPVLMATLLFSSVLIILGTLISDVCYTLIDPRIRP